MKKPNEEKKTIEDQIDEEAPISNKQMFDLIYELSKTYTWKAIQRYNLLKDAEIINTLAVIDMFKNPTQAARAQGMRTGLYYIEQVAKQETERRRKLQEELDGGGKEN